MHITFIVYHITVTKRNTKISAFNAFGAGAQPDSESSGCNSSHPGEEKREREKGKKERRERKRKQKKEIEKRKKLT